MALKQAAQALKRELQVYRAVAAHPQTPRVAKVLLCVAIGYALLPFDLIPDFLPVIGHLDDAILVPLLVIFAIRMIPANVVEECRALGRQSDEMAQEK